MLQPNMPRRDDLTPAQRAWLERNRPSPAYDPATVTFDRVSFTTGILLVECIGCGKRSMLTKENCPHIHPGNKARVRSVLYRCGNQACRSTQVRLYGGCDEEEARMFLAGDPVDEIRFIPEKAKWEK
jgi:hypothetical protein